MGMGVGLEKHMGSTRFLAMSIILGLVAGIFYVAICGTLRSITGDLRWLFYSSVVLILHRSKVEGLQMQARV